MPFPAEFPLGQRPKTRSRRRQRRLRGGRTHESLLQIDAIFVNRHLQMLRGLAVGGFVFSPRQKTIIQNAQTLLHQPERLQHIAITKDETETYYYIKGQPTQPLTFRLSDLFTFSLRLDPL